MMRSMQSRCWAAAVAVLALSLLATPATAGPAALAAASISPGGIQWQVNADYTKLTLTVSGPDGLILHRELAAGAPAAFDAVGDDGKPLPDGAYRYELVAAPRLDRATRRALAAARQSGDDSIIAKLQAAGKLPTTPMIQSGSFRIAEGALVQNDLVEPRSDSGPKPAKAASGLTPATAADQVIADDLIVQGSACIGFDCVNNESFGFDTLRLKENNTRIKFDDTSSSAGFPNTDWQLTANDSASGGQNKFSIEDITAGRVPFTIEGGSTTNSIYVDSTGRIGFRTSTPVLDLHIATGNTPGIRLEQNSAGGFSAQSWDIAGNETNFFIRDVTNGSKLPFRIRPGAPTSSIDIAASGNVGIGTQSPTEELTVKSKAGNSDVVVVQGSAVSNPTLYRFFETTGGDGLFSIFDQNGAEAARFSSAAGGRLGIGCNTPEHDIDLGGTVGAACSGQASRSFIDAGSTSFTASSSRTLKENLEPVRVPDILDKISAVGVYNYDFIHGPKNKIGLMAEDFHTIFEHGSDKLLNGQDVEMALWLAVQQLTAQNKTLEKRLEQLETQLKGSGQQP
jgi:hypothetical protein